MAFVARSKRAARDARAAMKMTCPVCRAGEIRVDSMMCRDCWSKRARVLGSIGEISDAFEVTYEVKETTHSGYCSDAGDYEEFISGEVRRLPILHEFFDPADLVGMNSDELIAKYDRILYAMYTPTSKGCGSGFCDGGTVWTIVKIVVIT